MQLQITLTKTDRLAVRFYQACQSGVLRQGYWPTLLIVYGLLYAFFCGLRAPSLSRAMLLRELVVFFLAPLLVHFQVFYEWARKARAKVWDDDQTLALLEHDSGERVLTFTPDDITEFVPLTSQTQRYRWTDFTSVQETTEHFFLASDPQAAKAQGASIASQFAGLLIPKRCFATAQEAQAFGQFSQRSWQEANPAKTLLPAVLQVPLIMQAATWRFAPPTQIWLVTVLMLALGIVKLDEWLRVMPLAVLYQQMFGNLAAALWLTLGTTVNLLLQFFIAFFVLIALHEAAHWLVARLSGLHVASLTIGAGKQLREFRWAGMRLRVNALPLGGVTTISVPPSFQNQRNNDPLWALAASVAAGPFLHLLLIGGWWLVADAVNAWPSGWLREILFRMRDVNYMLFLSNLIPVKFGANVSDGYQLVRMFTERAKVTKRYRQIYFVLHGQELARAGQYDESLAVYQAGAVCYPDHPYYVLPRAEIHRTLGDLTAARQTLLAALPLCEAPNHAVNLPHVQHELAYLDAVIGDPALLAEADEASQSAMQTLAHKPAVIGTRGCVLLRLGQIDAGLRYCQVAYQRLKDAQAKADQACWLALGEALRGNFTVAAEWWETAQAGAPQAFLKKVIERELAVLMQQAQPVKHSVTSVEPAIVV